jgi:hypothetical protein
MTFPPFFVPKFRSCLYDVLEYSAPSNQERNCHVPGLGPEFEHTKSPAMLKKADEYFFMLRAALLL